jgi:hypothetical protein
MIDGQKVGFIALEQIGERMNIAAIEVLNDFLLQALMTKHVLNLSPSNIIVLCQLVLLL